MYIIRKKIGKICKIFLPIYVSMHYNAEATYLVDNGGKKAKRVKISYAQFYNDYVQALEKWIVTGKK